MTGVDDRHVDTVVLEPVLQARGENLVVVDLHGFDERVAQDEDGRGSGVGNLSSNPVLVPLADSVPFKTPANPTRRVDEAVRRLEFGAAFEDPADDELHGDERGQETDAHYRGRAKTSL